MEELLKYDISSISYLFDSKDNQMKKASKHVLVQELEKKLSEEDKLPSISFDDTSHTTVIVDVMATLRKMNTSGVKTFGDLCDITLDYIFGSSRYADRVDFVFDSYVHESVKDSERMRRQTTNPIDLANITRDTPLPVKMETFWPSKENKLHLEKLLHEQIIVTAMKAHSEMHVVASHMSGDDEVPCKDVKDGKISTVESLHMDIDEADERIIPHAMHAVRNRTERIVVLSPDSDVTVLLLYYWETLLSNGIINELWVKAGVANTSRFIPLHTLSTQIGVELCHALPAIHTLTGCDYTSKFGTKTAALKADPLAYLAEFGKDPQLSVSQIEKSEAYLVQVIKRGSSYKTMDELRANLYFHSKIIDRSNLPPTSHATHSHIKRAFFAAHRMMTILNTGEPLDPLQYGYVRCDGLLTPDIGSKQIPEYLSTCCRCEACSTTRCACKREGLSCCAFCTCSTKGKECVNVL